MSIFTIQLYELNRITASTAVVFTVYFTAYYTGVYYL